MGKKRIILSLGKAIGNIALHAALAQHTNRPESRDFLQKEVIAYRDTVLKKSIAHHWNIEDKGKIKKEALHFARKRKEIRYPEVTIQISILQDEIDKVMRELEIT